MAALNDLLAVYTPTRDVTANKAQLIEDLGGDQDTVYANLLAATGLTRATASFNDALHAYLEPYNPLTAFAWKAGFYAGDPLWTPPADGDPVSSWRDGGSEGKNATQATGTKQPAYRASVAALNDKPAVQGDGVDDFLQTAAWSSALTQPYSVVAVVDAVTVNNSEGVIYGLTGSVAGILTDGFSQWAIVNGATVRSGSAATTGGHLLVATFDTLDTLDVDGTEDISANAGTTALTGLNMFATNAGTAPVDWHFAFVGAIAGDVTADANWPAFVAWVESTYGLTVA